jgi:hypothetical protein
MDGFGVYQALSRTTVVSSDKLQPAYRYFEMVFCFYVTEVATPPRENT